MDKRNISAPDGNRSTGIQAGVNRFTPWYVPILTKNKIFVSKLLLSLFLFGA
jgi:hypothetical protein